MDFTDKDKRSYVRNWRKRILSGECLKWVGPGNLRLRRCEGVFHLRSLHYSTLQCGWLLVYFPLKSLKLTAEVWREDDVAGLRLPPTRTSHYGTNRTGTQEMCYLWHRIITTGIVCDMLRTAMLVEGLTRHCNVIAKFMRFLLYLPPWREIHLVHLRQAHVRDLLSLLTAISLIQDIIWEWT